MDRGCQTGRRRGIDRQRGRVAVGGTGKVGHHHGVGAGLIGAGVDQCQYRIRRGSQIDAIEFPLVRQRPGSGGGDAQICRLTGQHQLVCQLAGERRPGGAGGEKGDREGAGDEVVAFSAVIDDDGDGGRSGGIGRQRESQRAGSARTGIMDDRIGSHGRVAGGRRDRKRLHLIARAGSDAGQHNGLRRDGSRRSGRGILADDEVADRVQGRKLIIDGDYVRHFGGKRAFQTGSVIRCGCKKIGAPGNQIGKSHTRAIANRNPVGGNAALNPEIDVVARDNRIRVRVPPQCHIPGKRRQFHHRN